MADGGAGKSTEDVAALRGTLVIQSAFLRLKRGSGLEPQMMATNWLLPRQGRVVVR